ncbi:hypothetical protein CLLU_27430 [Clostridium luticellarii]|uniref:Uncharacterized protein n=1 Tax=Clostridium luticellarii TaxID=1691940 RepID=A0A2T0BGJ9_9CLOT|nr:hypothetical protein CLLU_27430 [Clostridium luticellarii]
MHEKRIKMLEKYIPILCNTVLLLNVIFIFLCIVHGKNQFTLLFTFLFFFNLMWYALFEYIKLS